jgi:hypothetical protein
VLRLKYLISVECNFNCADIIISFYAIFFFFFVGKLDFKSEFYVRFVIFDIRASTTLSLKSNEL